MATSIGSNIGQNIPIIFTNMYLEIPLKKVRIQFLINLEPGTRFFLNQRNGSRTVSRIFGGKNQDPA